MKTPAGIECQYFYGDYYHGREREECRLLGPAWTSRLCRTCPAPAIARANACASMRLRAKVARPLTAGFQPRVKVTAYCEKSQRSGFDAHIGCGECHPFPPVFEVKRS